MITMLFKSCSRSVDKWCFFSKRYPDIKLSPNKIILFLEYALIGARHMIMIIIWRFLIMDILLKLIDVGLTYNANNTSINVLKNINLDIKFKETISVIGESGSGKTSLIMLIGGLEKNTSGKIFFMDEIQIWPLIISTSQLGEHEWLIYLALL